MLNFARNDNTEPMSDVLAEITPLSEKDCFHIAERHKSSFTYPIHRHREFELNFVQGAPGIKRVVGDSVEEIGEIDMALIGSENLEHAWIQNGGKFRNVREITIQFNANLLGQQLLGKSQFESIGRMFRDARLGIAFPMDAIMRIYGSLEAMTAEKNGFEQFLQFLHILYVLSMSDYRKLATNLEASTLPAKENARVRKAKDYIERHFAEDISLESVASHVGMSPSAFSRFFRAGTGRTLSTYIIEVRLGHAAHALVDTSDTVSDICAACGFNNMSNFNRTFKAKRGLTPREFRSMYRKTKIHV